MNFVFEHKLLMFLSISQHTYSFSHVVFRVSCEENGTSGRCYEVVSTSMLYCPRCLRLSRPSHRRFYSTNKNSKPHCIAHGSSTQDPNTGYSAPVNNVDELGDYESFAYDKDDPVSPRFFTSKYGAFFIAFSLFIII